MGKILIQGLCICLFAAILGFKTQAQDQTIGVRTNTLTNKEIVGKHKIMIVPFENRMYLSEIDHLINQDSKLSAKQIKATMRDGINEQLYKKLKVKMPVVDLMEDTVKTRKDLQYIYQYLGYQYQKVPNQSNYQAPSKEKEDIKIEKGQLNIETNTDARFMNAKIKNATLVPYLNGKYKTDLFLFINELDIKALTGSPADFNTNANRKIIMHYTVYTLDAKELNSGIAEVNLPPGINNPTKIVNIYFAQLADMVSNRIEKALLPKAK